MLAALSVIVMLAGIPAPNATVVRATCPVPTATGLCASREDRVVYVAGNADRFAFEHELGHLFDAQFLDDGERNALKRAVAIPVDRPWNLGTGLTKEGLASPSERVADLYAACRLRLDPDTRWETAYDYQPSRKQFRRACGVLRRAAFDYSDGSRALERPNTGVCRSGSLTYRRSRSPHP